MKRWRESPGGGGRRGCERTVEESEEDGEGGGRPEEGLRGVGPFRERGGPLSARRLQHPLVTNQTLVMEY